MVFTETRNIKKKKYYYRVISIRKNNKISKKRIYLGSELSTTQLKDKEKEADKKLLSKKIKKTEKELTIIKPIITKILKKNKVNKAGIFGSYSRGEQKKNSDIDIVINIEDKNISLLGFIKLKLKLEEALNKKVDLVEYSEINPSMKENILKEEIRIIWKEI